MTTEKMARIISRLSNNRVLKPEKKISNKALKTCSLLITLWLTNIAKACFVIGYYLRLKKAMTIVILHKEGKANYSLLKSYRLIALKNTLNKILKKVIINCIINTAEKHALLL